MSCFPCFTSKQSDSIKINDLPVIQAAEFSRPALPSSLPADKQNSCSGEGESKEVDVGNIAAKTFTFRELATATKNFRQECLLGDGGFGKIYNGTLKSSGQVVAVKRLDRNGMQGNREFLVEVYTLSLLKHKNLQELVGYCADGDQRLLVYEYMPLRSLDTHLFDNSGDKEPLDWTTRMKIASGAAQGLEYLHEKANPPIVYRDMKASNILLEEGYEARLCDFGLAKYAQSGNPSCTPPRLMNTYGYCAPEYTRTGQLTLKSDIYSFGVLLLELITGRRAMDPNRPSNEQNLVTWAQPIFKDPKRFPDMADPLLNGKFPIKSLNQAVGIAAMCLEEEPSVRPYITDVVAALSFLEMAPKDEITTPTSKLPPPIASQKENDQCDEEGDMSSHSSDYSSAPVASQKESDQCDEEGDMSANSSDYSSSDDEDDPPQEEDDHPEEDNEEDDHPEEDNEEEDHPEEDNEEEDHGSDSDNEEEDHDTNSDNEGEDHNERSFSSDVDHDNEEDNNTCSERDKEDDYGISQKHYKKSLKWRSKTCNAESSDDESMYSSSTRTSTSSSTNEEQRL